LGAEPARDRSEICCNEVESLALRGFSDTSVLSLGEEVSWPAFGRTITAEPCSRGDLRLPLPLSSCTYAAITPPPEREKRGEPPYWEACARWVTSVEVAEEDGEEEEEEWLLLPLLLTLAEEELEEDLAEETVLLLVGVVVMVAAEETVWWCIHAEGEDGGEFGRAMVVDDEHDELGASAYTISTAEDERRPGDEMYTDEARWFDERLDGSVCAAWADCARDEEEEGDDGSEETCALEWRPDKCTSEGEEEVLRRCEEEEEQEGEAAAAAEKPDEVAQPEGGWAEALEYVTEEEGKDEKEEQEEDDDDEEEEEDEGICWAGILSRLLRSLRSLLEERSFLLPELVLEAAEEAEADDDEEDDEESRVLRSFDEVRSREEDAISARTLGVWVCEGVGCVRRESLRVLFG
jgi:hypothetical protein